MGSISLMCPMCCGETFNNSESLKYHLLSMTDNLYCPACSLRTYSVAALIQHLDSCGKVSEQKNESIDVVMTEDKSKSDANAKEGPDILMEGDDAINDSFLATVNEEGIMIVGEGRTIQVDENGDIQVLEKVNIIHEDESISITNCDKDITSTSEEDNQISEPSILIQHNSEISSKTDESISNISGLLNESDNGLVSVTEFDEVQFDENGVLIVKKENTTEKEEEEVLYSCSTCGMSFTSVLEHIKVYHDGQEVVLEMGEQQIDEIENATVALEQSPALTSASTQNANNSVKKTTGSMKQRQSMNTLRTEECIDSDGRSYTRKVVQIERFWDRTPVTLSSTKAPMIEKFFSNVEGVKVRDKSVTVAPTRMYRCNQCLEQFAKLGDFRVHMCLQGNNRCDQCDQTFATTKALQSHIKIHENSDFPNQKIFLCTVCGTEFLTHKSLRLHSRMHAPVRARHVDAPEGTDEETFDCTQCGTTLSESYRAAHMALHAGNTITCSVCNRKFDSAESLAMHAAVHTEQLVINSPSTPVSDIVTTSSQDFTDPVFVTSGTTIPSNALASTVTAESADVQNQKPYQCQHCGRRFARPHEKVKHERIHTGEKPHSCEVCGKKFRVSYCLTLHMRTHTGVRPYECQHCGKRFKASSVYNHHLLTHGEERAYTCPYCPKTFKTRVQLAGHKNSHTKPFRCTECSRPFASLYAARAHIQTHKKDNNLKFSCNICGASYGRAFALKDHVKQHEKENILVPPEAAREEEIQEVESFLVQNEEEVEDEELIVPSPPACNTITTDLECED